MATLLQKAAAWFGWGGATGVNTGTQHSGPSSPLIEGATALTIDSALQISTVWSCVELVVSVIASLPVFVYEETAKGRLLARDALLYALLHTKPNSRMTPFEFWQALMLQLLLRGNAYARVERSANGEAFALWPMPSDQVEVTLLEDGSTVYVYTLSGKRYLLQADSVLHIKGMGNGIVGLSRLDYMRGSTAEAKHAQDQGSKLYANGGKPAGVLMVDRVLNDKQREAIRKNFGDINAGQGNRLHLLEADMKFQQLNLTPADQQLLQTRQFTVEEICRWFAVPAVLVNHSNVTAWGSGIESLIEGFVKFNLGPLLVNVQQAIAARVLTATQRARYVVEFSPDALLRMSLGKRIEVYSKGIGSSIYTPDEARALENLPPQPGGNQLLAPVNLSPLVNLGRLNNPGGKPNAAA